MSSSDPEASPVVDAAVADATGAADAVPLPSRSRWSSLFEDGPLGPRSIPAALAVLVPSLLVGWAAWAIADPPTRLERRFASLISALPSGLVDVLVAVSLVPAVVVLVLLVVAARSSPRAVAAGVAAVVRGAATAALLAAIGPGSTDDWVAHLDAAGAWAPTAWVLGPAAGLFVLANHLRGTSARLARDTAKIALLATVLAGAATPTGTIAAAALLVGLGALVALAVPDPVRTPDLDRLRRTLHDRGLDVGPLRAAPRGTSDRQRYECVDDQGDLVVDVRSVSVGRARLVANGFRQAWFRHVGDPVVVGAHRQIRHEALTTLLADAAGVPTDQVVRVVRLSDGDAALVTRPVVGRPIAESSDGRSAPVGPRLWPVLDRLHGAGLHHGRVDADHLVDDGDRLALVDFEVGGEADPVEQQIDRAQALVTSVLVDGQDAAVDAARVHLGDRLGDVVSYLQPATLTGIQRAARPDLPALRTATAEVAGVPEPMLAPVKRVKPLAALQIALLPVAIAALWAVASEIDRELLWEQVRDASIHLVVAALLVGQIPRVAQAFSSLGASPVPIPIGPLYALQLAVSYVNLVVPGGAGRVALNVRFYQRFGLPAGSALAVGALDGIGGLIVQAIVVAAMAAVGVASLDLDLDLGVTDDATGLLRPLLLVVVIVVIALAVFGKLRRKLFGWVADAIRDAGSVFDGLWSVRRLGLLVSGNLASDIAFAASLLMLTHAFGDPVGFVELLIITMAVAVLAWVIPVPGGIGVSETGLLVGLVGAGMAEETAFAAMVVYRIAVFYAPPIWGFFALRWLERNRYV